MSVYVHAQARPIAVAAADLDILKRKPRSLWKSAWSRLLRNKAAMAGLTTLIAFYLIALFAPIIAPHDPNKQNLAYTTLDPFWTSDGDRQFLLGTDELGEDVLSRLIYGARVSMVVGLVPIFVYLPIGGLIGVVAGFRGGVVDNLLMRVADVFYAFPQLLFLIIVMAAYRATPLGQALSGLLLIMIALTLVGWEGMARLVRGQVLAVREKEFIEAARCLGASNARIMFRHIFPNVLAPVIVALAFAVPTAIMAEAVLSFLGLGITPPTASWGSMIIGGLQDIYSTPVLTVAPAVCIAMVMLACTFLGDGLRDAFDPRMQ